VNCQQNVTDTKQQRQSRWQEARPITRRREREEGEARRGIGGIAWEIGRSESGFGAGSHGELELECQWVVPLPGAADSESSIEQTGPRPGCHCRAVGPRQSGRHCLARQVGNEVRDEETSSRRQLWAAFARPALSMRGRLVRALRLAQCHESLSATITATRPGRKLSVRDDGDAAGTRRYRSTVRYGPSR
jgi:hypothetical protein